MGGWVDGWYLNGEIGRWDWTVGLGGGIERGEVGWDGVVSCFLFWRGEGGGVKCDW